MGGTVSPLVPGCELRAKAPQGSQESSPREFGSVLPALRSPIRRRAVTAGDGQRGVLVAVVVPIAEGRAAVRSVSAFRAVTSPRARSRFWILASGVLEGDTRS